jgi:hypothetical protein
VRPAIEGFFKTARKALEDAALPIGYAGRQNHRALEHFYYWTQCRYEAFRAVKRAVAWSKELHGSHYTHCRLSAGLKGALARITNVCEEGVVSDADWEVYAERSRRTLRRRMSNRVCKHGPDGAKLDHSRRIAFPSVRQLCELAAQKDNLEAFLLPKKHALAIHYAQLDKSLRAWDMALSRSARFARNDGNHMTLFNWKRRDKGGRQYADRDLGTPGFFNSQAIAFHVGGKHSMALAASKAVVPPDRIAHYTRAIQAVHHRLKQGVKSSINPWISAVGRKHQRRLTSRMRN